MRGRLVFALLFGGVLLLGPALVRADPAPAPGPGEDDQLYSCRSKTGEVAMAFKPELEVRDLLVWVMGFTCKNFVLDPKIVNTSRKVTIIAPSKMSAPEAYRMFLVALASINYTLVPKGNVIKVIEAGAGRRDTVPFHRQGVPDNNEQLVRYIYRPAYAAADALAQGLAHLKSDVGDVQVVSGMLLVTDYGSTINDMVALAKLIDVPHGSDAIFLVPVKHAEAGKLADKLGQLLGVGAAVATATRPGAPAPVPAPSTAPVPAKLLVDERTNTIILAGSEAAYRRVKTLVEQLDQQLDIEGGTTFHVVRLRSAIAEELAKTLTDSIAGGQPAKRPAGTAPPAPTSPADAALDGQVKVIADRATNSLIVISSGRDFPAVRTMIQELDAPRRQVYVEVMILEVSQTTTQDIGASAHVGAGSSTTGLALAGVQLPDLKSTSAASLLSATGLVGGLLGPAQTILGQSVPSYGALFRAIAGTSNTRILSEPSIIGVDNEEAKQKVGINIPYSRGSVTNLASSTSVQQQFDRRDLNVELSIRPHIASDDSVLLEVKHDAQTLGDGPDTGGGPTWATRSLDTRVVVRDQQTVVVGGMVQELETNAASKVPFLGDIPLLGYLFKSTKKERRRSNVLIMLTPYIIRDVMDLQRIQERKLREFRELATSFEALDRMAYRPRVNYGHKRGLVEEINRSVLEVEAEIAERAAAAAAPSARPEGPATGL
jgi:general secretion pathway protein D